MNETKKLASDIRQTLVRSEGLVKRAEADKNAALRKLASANEENGILRDTLDLVSKGLIDPSDVMDRVEEFRSDPKQIEVIKEAFKLGFDTVPTLGTVTGDEKVLAEGGNVVEKTLIELEPYLRKTY